MTQAALTKMRKEELIKTQLNKIKPRAIVKPSAKEGAKTKRRQSTTVSKEQSKMKQKTLSWSIPQIAL